MSEMTLADAAALRRVGANEEERSPTTFSALRRTARVAGLWYLALAITGGVGFLLVRPSIHVEGDPAATLANLIDRAGLARAGLALELGLVVTQALAAVWFYKLFRSVNGSAAWALAVFGMMNAVAIMASAGFTATALAVSSDFGLAPGGDPAGTVQLLYQLSSGSWGVGSLFFGLWLIPMGHIASSSGLMPEWLGRILVLGGVGYVLSAFVGHGVVDAPVWLVEGLPLPATIGEFWMIGYLLLNGVRSPQRNVM
ncbi:MAG TPA: DUF4386 domain-containing protein [Acidimicrobiia bacterium]|nr:DUF4386 domain-containing protein [Acidimicrobiia bacterium]